MFSDFPPFGDHSIFVFFYIHFLFLRFFAAFVLFCLFFYLYPAHPMRKNTLTKIKEIFYVDH